MCSRGLPPSLSQVVKGIPAMVRGSEMHRYEQEDLLAPQYDIQVLPPPLRKKHSCPDALFASSGVSPSRACE